MSSNNEIIIKKQKKKWRVSHNDLDCGEISEIGKYNTLDEAVIAANKFKEKCNEDGYGIEYGLNIIAN